MPRLEVAKGVSLSGALGALLFTKCPGVTSGLCWGKSQGCNTISQWSACMDGVHKA